MAIEFLSDFFKSDQQEQPQQPEQPPQAQEKPPEPDKPAEDKAPPKQPADAPKNEQDPVKGPDDGNNRTPGDDGQTPKTPAAGEKKPTVDEMKAKYASDEDGPRNLAPGGSLGEQNTPFLNFPESEQADPPASEDERVALAHQGVYYDNGGYHRMGGANDDETQFFTRKDGTPMSKKEVQEYLLKERQNDFSGASGMAS